MGDLGQVGEEVTTIRVINVPSHTTETEFNCWFLFAPGFEQATLVPTRGHLQSQLGWARFASVEAAQAAIQTLNGRSLTEDQSPEGIVLTADFARSNYRPNPSKKRAQQLALPPAPHVPAIVQPVQVQPQRILPPPQPVAPQRPKCSTLFLGGLPDGCLEQDLNMFFSGHCGGFERLKFVNPSDGKPGMGFAKFATAEHAEAALQMILAGIALPSCPTFALQAEFAKHELDQPAGVGGVVAPQYTPPPPQYAPPPQYVVPQQVRRNSEENRAAWSCSGTEAPPPPRQPDGATPCDTMFVGCLPPTVTEQEIEGVLLMYPGFVRTKLCGLGQPRPVAFVLFDSVDSCSAAIAAMHGTRLPSAPQQAVTCEFAKNSLDKRQRIA